jgi:hypothetical protein
MSSFQIHTTQRITRYASFQPIDLAITLALAFFQPGFSPGQLPMPLARLATIRPLSRQARLLSFLISMSFLRMIADYFSNIIEPHAAISP